MIRSRRLTAPIVEPVPLDGPKGAKHFLRQTVDVDDLLVSSLIISAREAAEDYTGRVFISQQWEFIAEWPHLHPGDSSYFRWLENLPKQPVISIDEFSRLVGGTNYQAVFEADYRPYTGEAGGIVFHPDRQTNYIAELRAINGWHIIATFGYGESPDDVPERIKLAILHYVAYNYDRRGEPEVKDNVFERYLTPFVWNPL